MPVAPDRSRPMRSACGAAMAEALIVLPVLSLLLLAVPLLRELYAARQAALGEARSCGFAYALGGCSALPEACGAPRRDAAPAPGPENDVVAIARAHAGQGAGLFDDLPLLADALAALLGDTVEVGAAVELRPRARRQAVVHGAILLLCNERPRDVLAIAQDLFCAHLPLLDCGGGS